MYIMVGGVLTNECIMWHVERKRESDQMMISHFVL
jgi:hypothetical protein